MLTIMAQEVAEQPAAIAATLKALRPLRARIAQLAQNRQQILFVARGSSDNAAVYGRYLLEVHAGRTASLAAPSVATHYRSQLDLTGAVVVAISQSGQTEEIVATQEWARNERSRRPRPSPPSSPPWRSWQLRWRPTPARWTPT